MGGVTGSKCQNPRSLSLFEGRAGAQEQVLGANIAVAHALHLLEGDPIPGSCSCVTPCTPGLWGRAHRSGPENAIDGPGQLQTLRTRC
jgi:hypothetical protein